jgi:hypothetical protein
MIVIGFKLRDYIVEKYPNRKVVGYVSPRVAAEERYVQVSTFLDDMDIHYELYQNHVELHLEGKYHNAENQEFVNQLHQQSAGIPSLSWLSWQEKERFRCQIDMPANSWEEVKAAFDAIIAIFDPIIEKTKKNQNMENQVTLEARTLNSILFNDKVKLSLPKYQRAYEWKKEHVIALLDDTYEAFVSKKAYILGTIILHQTEDKIYDIVDGQQRLVTLSILFKDKLKENKDSLLCSVFDNLKSQYYIQNTNKIINNYLKNKDRDNYLDYLQSDKVKFSVLYIPTNQLSLAFTFFDSLNSKGMLLSDYDLLKAHHLMFIPENQENLARKHNDEWQSKDDKHNELFEKILRQIRVWSRGHGEEGGGERLVYNEFVSAIDEKDLDKDEHVLNRYMQPNVFRSWNRENDQIVLNMRYPSQNVEDLIPMEIPQTIEGGDAFFLYAKRYHKMYELLFGEPTGEKKSSAIHYADELSKAIRNDYLRNAYKAIILLYFDKFGEQKLIELATCVELLLSTLRFPKAGGQTFIRQSRVKQYVNEQEIIPVILNSSYLSHALSQLKHKIGNTPFEAEGYTKNSQDNYKADMENFYNRHIHVLHNDSIKSQVNHLYQRNQKQDNNE